MKAINDGIVTKVNELTGGNHNAFYTAIGGRFYYVEAPQSAVFPFSVYRNLDELHNWDFGAKKRKNVTVQIDCFSETPGAAEIETCRDALLNLFDYKTVTLTVTSYTFIYMKLVGALGPDKIEGVWNYNSRFEVEVEA